MYTIEASNGGNIRLTFETFQLERNDCLYIYDGSDESARPISRGYCGRQSPGTISSSGNFLFLKFVTDRISGDVGFRAWYDTGVTGKYIVVVYKGRLDL